MTEIIGSKDIVGGGEPLVAIPGQTDGLETAEDYAVQAGLIFEWLCRNVPMGTVAVLTRGLASWQPIRQADKLIGEIDADVVEQRLVALAGEDG